MKNEVIEYVMNSPGNTNRAVLESMLQTINGGSGVTLPVVKITSDVAGNGGVLSEDETAQLAKALESDIAAVILNMQGIPRVFLCAKVTQEEMTVFVGSASIKLEAEESPGHYITVTYTLVCGVVDGVGSLTLA